MKKLFALTIGLLIAVTIVALHPGQATDCPTMSQYMINPAGECINLAAEPANQFAIPGANIQRASAATPQANQSIDFPPQQNVNEIVVRNNSEFLTAVRRLKAGDRLLLRNGVYQARVTSAKITVTAQGTADNWVVIAAYPGDKPQIKGTDWAGISFNGAQYVEMRGLEVIGAYISQNPSGSGIAITDRSHHIRLLNNTVHDVPGGAIEVQYSDYIHLEGNTIYNAAGGWLPDNPERSNANSAMSFYQLTDADQSEAGIRNIVRSNVVFNTYNTRPFIYSDRITDGNCFILDDTQHTQSTGVAVQKGFTDAYTGTTLVENNLCFDNGGRGVHAFLSDNLIARNNTLYRNTKTPGVDGELSTVQSNNVGFYNNIIYANANAKAIANFRSNNVDIENNLVFGSDQIDPGVGRLIQADPAFVNPSTDVGTADFFLRANSPAIRAGTPDNCATTYFDGSSRNGTCDIGAFPVAQ
jgi:parallel beta-helix repeat protein